jgi:two-component system, OmpR family, response regulator VicR
MDAGKINHIIYVEDDPEIVDLVSLILDRHGYEVSGVYNGREGLQRIIEEKPDLVLLDLMIPELDGWEIFQKLKNHEDTANIPIIIITAKSQPIDQVIGIHIAKVDGYICKPFHPQEILDSIEKVLENRKSSSQVQNS